MVAIDPMEIYICLGNHSAVWAYFILWRIRGIVRREIMTVTFRGPGSESVACASLYIKAEIVESYIDMHVLRYPLPYR